MNLEKTLGWMKKISGKRRSNTNFVKNGGMIAVVTVSGLHDEEDHNIIIEALKGSYL